MKRILLLLILMPSVIGQWIQPIDCDALLDEELQHEVLFDKDEGICYYGTGFDGDVNITLKNNVEEESKIVQSSNGVISSLVGGMHRLFASAKGGVYRLFADGSEYGEDITIRDQHPDQHQDIEQVPEFENFAVVILGAALIIAWRRR